MSNLASFVKPFNREGVFHYLSTKWIGRNIVYKDETPTTMDDAKELGMRGRPAGTAVLAELQTKARGAHDRQWSATNTGNIYVSFILHRPPSQQNFVGRFNVEVAAALAVVMAARSVGVKNARTKWPNDVWVEGHKLAGCLCEDTDFNIPGSSPALSLSILGVGVNVNADVRRSPGLQAVATSICCELGGQRVDREVFFGTLCNQLEVNLARDPADLHREFVSLHIFSPPCQVLLYPTGGGVKEMAFQAIEKDWSITVKSMEGQVVRGTSAEYSIRPRPLHTAYVLKATHQDSTAPELVSRALLALLNTATTAVKFLQPNDLRHERWRQDASFLVVCGGDGPHPNTWEGKGGEILASYLQTGGRVLAIEQGASLMHHTLHHPPFTVEKVKGDANRQVTLQRREGDKAGDKLQTLTSQDSVGFGLQQQQQQHEHAKKHQVLASYTAPGSNADSKAGSNTDSKASSHADSKASSHADSKAGSAGLAAVAVVEVGQGRLGLCGVNLAQSFHDSAMSEQVQSTLRGLDLYKIDSLFSQLLKKLSP